jgi:hypothetical protein
LVLEREVSKMYLSSNLVFTQTQRILIN